MLQYLFFLRPLSTKARDIADFGNTQKERQREKKWEERNVSQMKKQHQITVRGLTKMDISNIPDREFKVINIKILTGLEKRV